MSSKLPVDENVKEFIAEIIAKNNLDGVTNIKYEAGSQIGDGYVSKTIAVDIDNGSKTRLKVFLKCALNVKSTDAMPINKAYSNEIYFYEVIYPAYREFLQKLSAEDLFHHVPKCYGTSSKYNIIALENLKAKGFTLFDKSKNMNDDHIVPVLKTFAKFHAISFAFKDQHREKYDNLTENTFDVFNAMAQTDVFCKPLKDSVKRFISTLDPAKHQHILAKATNLPENVITSLASPMNYRDKYSIITQGDCWCNNMMFLYEEENKDDPIDIMLIDWQLVREASPVFDLSYFFYPVATQAALDNLDYYLEVYHKELSTRIKELGSDSELLYPFQVFKEEWKKHCKYGFATAFMILKAMLSSQEEAFNIEDFDFENEDGIHQMYQPIKQQDEINRRLTMLADHLVKNEFL